MGIKEELEKLKKECEDANLPLKEGAKNLVFGKGTGEGEIVFVGEAPGKFEDEQGEPFVGKAGKNLDGLLERVGLSLEKVYVTNILKYRPPENRDPLPEEIKEHGPWLVKQIKEIKPKVVCSLGNYATKFFLANGNVEDMKNKEGITKLHGKIREIDFMGEKIRLIPLFHPAAIIYNRALIAEWEKDMEIVKMALKERQGKLV
jgi:uracil-DNA glycosylase